MSRILPVLAFLSLAIAAQAQVNVSADLSYSNSGFTYNRQGYDAFNKELPAGSQFLFRPHIGYAVDDTYEIGLHLGIEKSHYSYTDGYYDPVVNRWKQSTTDGDQLMTLSVSPYLRRRLASFGRLTLHAELSATYGRGFGTHSHTEYHASDGWEITTDVDMQRILLCVEVLPVFNYEFSSHLSMDVYLNILALTYSKTTDKQWTPTSTSGMGNSTLESVTKTTDWSAGLNALNTSLASIGFCYTF